MPVYLMRFSYTPETWSRLIENPEDRRDAARAYLEQVGGALHGFWYGFGEYDGVVIVEAPDEKAMTGFIATALGAGHIRATKTTVLMTPKDAMEALGRSKGTTFQAPGGKR